MRKECGVAERKRNWNGRAESREREEGREGGTEISKSKLKEEGDSK